MAEGSQGNFQTQESELVERISVWEGENQKVNMTQLNYSQRCSSLGIIAPLHYSYLVIVADLKV